MTEYFYTNRWEEGRSRLKGLEQLEDEATKHLLKMFDLTEGDTCLEIGAGAGSIAQWLCEQVGKTGRVVATDTEPHFLRDISNEALEIRNHDITIDDIEEDQYDLVHVRHVLIHIQSNTNILDKLVKALKPGGALLIEESDFSTNRADSSSSLKARILYDKIMQEVYALYEKNGMDIHIGSHLLDELRSFNLHRFGKKGRVYKIRGGTQNALFHKKTYEQLAPRLMQSKIITKDLYEKFLTLFDDPSFFYQSRMTVATWGYWN